MSRLKNITEDGLKSLLAKKGLDYEVGTIETPSPFDDEPTGNWTSYRKDNKKIFAQGLSSRWQPIQNFDAFRCLVGLAGSATLENLHVLKDGAEVVAQISLGNIKVGNRGDTVGKYLSLVNSHDGTGSLLNLITPRRFWCSNQINAALQLARSQDKRKSNMIMRIQHTASAAQRIDQLIESVHIADGEFQASEELYNRLYNTRFDESYVWDVLKRLFPLKSDASDRSKVMWTNRLTDMAARFENADNNRTPRDSAWNLYNSIQSHLQHYGGNPESRFRNALHGHISNQSADAMTAVLDITSSQNISEALKSEIEELTA